MPADVEFVEAADDDVPAAPATRPRRWWLLVVTALVLGAIVYVVTRPSARTPHAAPPGPTSLPATATPSRPGIGAVPHHALATPTPGVTSARCGGAPLCSVSFLVPDALDAALRAHLPGVRGLRVETSLAQSLSTGGSYLADRVIYIRDPRNVMRISIHRLRGDVPEAEAIAVGVVRVRVRTSAFVIDVLFYPTSHAALPTADMRALARDVRLEVV